MRTGGRVYGRVRHVLRRVRFQGRLRIEMYAAIEDLGRARLIEHEVGDQISPDRVRTEEGKEDAEEQTDGHLRRLLLVLGMVTCQMIQIGRLGCPQWSCSQTNQSST